MRSLSTGHAPVLAAAVLGIVSVCGLPAARAATLTFDANGASPAAPVDGSGVWDTTTANWSTVSDPSGMSPNAPADVVWPNTGTDVAVFGNNGGTVGVTNDYAVTVAAGGVTAGGITFNPLAGGGSTLHSTDYRLAGGTITLGSTTTPIIVNNTSSTNLATYPDAVISSVLVGTGGFVESGAGVLTINANNTFTGGATVRGTVYLSQRSNGGGGTGTPFGANTNTLTIDGGTIVNNASGGTVYLQYATITNSGTTAIYGGNGTTVIGANTSALTGSGTMTLGVNAKVYRIYASATGFTGTLLVNGGGTLTSYQNGGNFYGGTGLTLDLENTAFATTNNSTGNTINFGALTSTSTTSVLNGSTTAGNTVYSVGALNTFTTYNGTIGSASTAAALTKVGTGSLTLTNASTYAGPTNVNAGTLFVNNATGSGTGTGAVTVAAAGTLAGTGILAGVVTDNGTVAPGATAATIGAMTFSNAGNTTINGTYAVDLQSDGTSDLLKLTNLVLGAASTLSVNALSSAAATPYTIATYTGTLTGTFLNVPAGYAVNYGTGSNSAITLSLAAAPLPEPTTLAAVGLAGLMLKRRRRA